MSSMNRKGNEKAEERKKTDFKQFKIEDDLDLPPPLAPVCTAINFNSITLEWGQDDSVADKLYIIEWSNQNKKWDTMYKGNAKSEVLKSLYPDTTYYFRVRYRKAMAESDWSNVLEVTTEKEPESMLDLHQAVQNDNYDKVVSIIKKDKNHQLKIDSPDRYGHSPLMKALQTNSNRIAELLIKHGADINYCDASGRNCLMTACFAGNLEAVKFLRKLGSLWTDKDQFGNTPLHYAIDGDSLEVIRLAIKDGANVNEPNKNGWTPLLRHANIGGKIEITKFLISEGANINYQDNDGNTALILATIKNNLFIVDELVNKNCDLTVKNKKERTVIEIAEGLQRNAILDLINKKMKKKDQEESAESQDS